MTRIRKLINSAVIAVLLGGVLSPAAEAKMPQKNAPTLTLYAGPQTVAPFETIHVTIEAVDGDGRNIDGETLALTYTVGGIDKTVTATASRGLASFDIPAQGRSGNMTFTAQHAGQTSGKSLVMVVAGPPRTLHVSVRRGKAPDTVYIKSPIITDSFGNPVTDLSLVSLDWIDGKGLKGRVKTQLSNGMINRLLHCPASFQGVLRLQASLGRLKAVTADLSRLCANAEAIER